MLFVRTLRQGKNHCLSVIGGMSQKDLPYARVNIPLSRGAIEPVDARAFRGIRFETRGEGEYHLLVPTRGVPGTNFYQAPFTGSAAWKTVRIPFSALKQATGKSVAPWTGSDLLMVGFEMARRAGEMAWLQIDNVQFYK